MDVKEMDVKKSQRFSFGISLHTYAVVSSCSPRISPWTPATSHNSNEIYYCFRCLLSFWPFGSVAIELNSKMVSLVRQSIMFPYWGERRLKELEAISVISRTGWCMCGSGLTLSNLPDDCVIIQTHCWDEKHPMSAMCSETRHWGRIKASKCSSVLSQQWNCSNLWFCSQFSDLLLLPTSPSIVILV